jgi:hypothetical protein
MQEEERAQYKISRRFKSFREMVGEKPKIGKPKIGNMCNAVKPFVNGGDPSMLAMCAIQPVNKIKVHIKLGEGSDRNVETNMLTDEGFGALYKGLLVGLLRQATYTTCLGSFRSMMMSHIARALIFIKASVAMIEDPLDVDGGEKSIEEKGFYAF